MGNNILNGIMGLCVADALGVPVEFNSRETLKKKPVVDMRSYGTYNQPAGTWSDDTSMTLCLVDSLAKGLDYKDIMNNFIKWIRNGEFTPYGEVFAVGKATRKALERYEQGTDPLACGGREENDNGNGSLMRILPMALYLQSVYGKDFTVQEEAMALLHDVSSLTHAHKRSLIACGIYASIANAIMDGMPLSSAISRGIYEALNYYRKQNAFANEIYHFERLGRQEFYCSREDQIKSSGYVVDTLEAAIFCLMNTKSYEACVLAAVNLGEDTDTVAAVAGGLAGLHYGYESIPKEWLAVIAKRDYIEGLCTQLHVSFQRNGIDKLQGYIPYFETATAQSVSQWSEGEKREDGTISSPCPNYDEKLKEFISTVYQTKLMDNDYGKTLSKYGLPVSDELMKHIDNANFELLKAILTCYVRQEKFCSGLWASAVENKVFYKILNRFNALGGYTKRIKKSPVTDYIVTYSGIKFYPVEPVKEDISIVDIAHSLSLMTRANGHFKYFYSVGQHSVNCCKEAKSKGYSQRVQLGCLLHDASESYLSDITRPVKHNLPEYRLLEEKLQRLVYDRFGLGEFTVEEKEQIGMIDDILLHNEFMTIKGYGIFDNMPELSMVHDFSQREFNAVEKEFISLFNQLTGISQEKSFIGSDGCKG